MGGEFPANATAYTTQEVFDGRKPILLVTHELDGDWQFLDGGVFDFDQGIAVHLAHIVESQPELSELADLPSGWAAERGSEEHGWERYPLPAESA